MDKKKLNKGGARAPSNRVAVHVFKKGVTSVHEIPFLKRKLALLLLALDSKIPPYVGEVSVTFCSDAYIKKLNAQFRGKDKATDVLSFPLLSGDDPFCPSLGDMIVSVPTAYKQAKEFGVSRQEELLRLCIHGILHLLGYDHENVSQSKRMQMKRAEKRLWQILAQNPLK